MCCRKTRRFPVRAQRSEVVILIILGLILSTPEAIASRLTIGDSSGESRTKDSLGIEECQISDAALEAIEGARRAIKNAWAAGLKAPELPEFLELYFQAREAAKPPDCDSDKAKSLADKSRQLANDECPSKIAQDAILAATNASTEKGKPIDVEDLIYQAEVAMGPPECDSATAIKLANKARQLASQPKPSIWSGIQKNEDFWVLLSMILVAF